MLPVTRRNVASVWSDPFDLLDRFFGPSAESGNGGTGDLVGRYPVDIHEDDHHVYVEAEMPGFGREDIEVTLEDAVLTISGERKVDEEKGEQHLRERRYTRVNRSFTLPSTLDESAVEASLSDGVLHVTLNKREEVKPRKITVK